MTASHRIRLVGVLSVDEEPCRAAAALLAMALTGRRAGGASVPAGGRPAGLLRGLCVLPHEAFRPRQPFTGPLFAALESIALAGRRSAAAAGSYGVATAPCLGLVVPLAPLESGRDDGVSREAVLGRAPTGPVEHPSSSLRGACVAITDHVDLAGPGPLAGSWPAGRPRAFPAMSSVYVPDVAAELLDMGGKCQPADGRSAAGPAIYSRLAVAGVADTGRPTVFEVEQARAAGLLLASSCLVAPVVIAAYYGLVVAAVGVLGDR